MGGRLALLRWRIEDAGGDAEAVTVVAVTKGFGPEAVAAAVANGLVDVGENYAAELVSKAEHPASGGVRFHFLGALQSNKVARLVPLVHCFQSVSREKEGEALARRTFRGPVLVEVDTTMGHGPAHRGVTPTQAAALVGRLRDLSLNVTGLMTVAPRAEAAAQKGFSTLSALCDELSLPQRSMGMTDDLEAAVAAGSTMVRIGRGLFGPRPAAR